jgi:hypothetical protein
MPSPELIERVAELRRAGRTPKEIARALGLKPSAVAPLIRAVGAASPAREAPLAGCWVTDHWAHKMTVRGHAEWPGMSDPETDDGESGLVGVLVARETGSSVLACGFLVDVWCLGVKDTNGPKTVDRRKLPDFTRLFFSAWEARPPVAAPLELARHVVFGAVDYARGMGLEPHPDFARGAALLGEWVEGSSDVSFGADGTPMYINGPRDDTFGNLAKLRESVGAGNFESFIQAGGSQIID